MVRRSAFEAAGGFSARLWLGGEEELLASDLARAGWQMSYLPEIVVHHEPSEARDPHLRRRHGIRNTLWFTWLRRPAGRALLRTARLALSVPHDRISLQGFLDAARGVLWVAVERRVVPRARRGRLPAARGLPAPLHRPPLRLLTRPGPSRPPANARPAADVTRTLDRDGAGAYAGTHDKQP